MQKICIIFFWILKINFLKQNRHSQNLINRILKIDSFKLIFNFFGKNPQISYSFFALYLDLFRESYVNHHAWSKSFIIIRKNFQKRVFKKKF
jgi:hypothetical protein